MRLGEDLKLGSRLLVGATHILCSSPLKHHVALTDLNPILPSHAVIMPLSGEEHAQSLDDAAWLDMWRAVHIAQLSAEQGVGANASNLLLRDGTHAAWAGAPVHVHCVPRLPGDLERSDDIFSAMEAWLPPKVDSAGGGPPPWSLPDDADRRDRSFEEMAAEASVYREHLQSTIDPVARAFGRFSIPHEHVLYDSPSGLSQAFVNLRPLTVGHVLVTSRRVSPRLHELSAEERDDLWRTVRIVQAAVLQEQSRLGSSALCEIGVQDGRHAGQSVPHVHAHIIPRG